MVLVDTSVWVEHLRRGHAELIQLLDSGAVVTHPFVIGELACGSLRNRAQILGLLHRLPRTPRATEQEVLAMIEQRALPGRGIGYVDAHLLAAAMLGAASLLSLDRRLREIARELKLGFEPT